MFCTVGSALLVLHCRAPAAVNATIAHTSSTCPEIARAHRHGPADRLHRRRWVSGFQTQLHIKSGALGDDQAVSGVDTCECGSPGYRVSRMNSGEPQRLPTCST